MTEAKERDVEIRRPEPHEIEAFLSCLDAGFSMRLLPAEHDRLAEALTDAAVLAAFDGLDVVATAVTYPVEVTLPGLVIDRAGALSEVAVAPTHRRRGIGRSLISAMLAQSHERGEALMLLHASEAGIYQRFGFGVATYSARYAIARDKAALRPVDAPKGRIRLLGRAEAAEVLPAVYDVARRLRPGEVSRAPRRFEELVGDGELPEQKTARFFACHEHDGEIDGYLVYDVTGSIEEPTERELVLVELVSVSSAAYRALYAYALGVDLVGSLRTGDRPIDEPARHLLADPRALRTTEVRDRTWVRLVDVAQALAARRYDREGGIDLEVVDPLSPWNEGRYSLVSGEAGRARVERGGRPELLVTAESLAHAFFGAVRFTSLVEAGTARELVEGSARAADRLFFSDPTPFCTADF